MTFIEIQSLYGKIFISEIYFERIKMNCPVFTTFIEVFLYLSSDRKIFDLMFPRKRLFFSKNPLEKILIIFQILGCNGTF